MKLAKFMLIFVTDDKAIDNNDNFGSPSMFCNIFRGVEIRQ